MIDYKTARKSMERRPYSLRGLRTSRENLTPAVHAFKELILRRKKIDRLQSNITTAIARMLNGIKK